MKKESPWILLVCTIFASSISANLSAQAPSTPPILEATRPVLGGEVPLYPGKPPGSKPDAAPEQWDSQAGELMARNVSVPTLIPVLPPPGKATGAAVLIAPGGAYMLLSMDNEGLEVARALAERGIAAFVLKYRLDATPRDIPGFEQALGARMAGVVTAGGKGAPPTFQPLAVDDAAAALRLIRARAAEWKVDPDRTGMIGFSAGAMTTLQLALEDRPDARPSFVGLLYGPTLAVKVPAQAGPLFAALASDDPLFGHEGLGLVESWQNAGLPVELHFFEHGGHGFGMYQRGSTSDLWFQEFLTWMKDRGLMRPRT